VKMRRIIGPLLVFAFLCLLYWDTFIWLGESWLSNPYYGHGFLIPVVSVFVAWRKRGELQSRAPSSIGAVLLALGLLVYIMGFFWYMRFLQAFSFLIVLYALIHYFYGPGATRAMTFPLCLLVFMIPPPFLNEFGYHLQSFSAHHSASLVGAIGIPVTTLGAEIGLEDSTFVVGLPCSGLNTFISLLALAAIFVYLLTGPFYKKAILLALAFPIAILANVLRIASLLLIADHFGAKAATGFFHGFSSLLFFLIAFLCLVVLARLLKCSIILPVRGGGRS
jgi:exosortase